MQFIDFHLLFVCASMIFFDVLISLYRICQELVNNIVKHSGATEVNIQLLKNKEAVTLIVEDNGKGMTTGDEQGHDPHLRQLDSLDCFTCPLRFYVVIEIEVLVAHPKARQRTTRLPAPTPTPRSGRR